MGLKYNLKLKFSAFHSMKCNSKHAHDICVQTICAFVVDIVYGTSSYLEEQTSIISWLQQIVLKSLINGIPEWVTIHISQTVLCV
jgi:hypothetical protein